MKHIKDTKVIEKAISYDGDTFMVWEYTNHNLGNTEVAVMDSTGYDVSLMAEVLEDGHVDYEAVIHCIDPEDYVHEQFITFN